VDKVVVLEEVGGRAGSIEEEERRDVVQTSPASSKRQALI
jgi:hypothetical protein